MPTNLLTALTRLAVLKGYRSPAAILWSHIQRQTRPKPTLYWTKD